MQLGVAEARRRFKELLDRVAGGETLEITRRNTVIAVLAPPTSAERDQPLGETLLAWRDEWAVDSWPDEQLFDGIRDLAPGRASPW